MDPGFLLNSSLDPDVDFFSPKFSLFSPIGAVYTEVNLQAP